MASRKLVSSLIRSSSTSLLSSWSRGPFNRIIKYYYSTTTRPRPAISMSDANFIKLISEHGHGSHGLTFSEFVELYKRDTGRDDVDEAYMMNEHEKNNSKSLDELRKIEIVSGKMVEEKEEET
ncbi:hypothetical protein RIF29_28449 [Crotalaria pallida]|uniref:Uncharacterized protein n=1 Tax=Crotalaria pallida TaxID=3830 RepID=A0AAN9ECN4_CROPI